MNAHFFPYLSSGLFALFDCWYRLTQHSCREERRKESEWASIRQSYPLQLSCSTIPVLHCLPKWITAIRFIYFAHFSCNAFFVVDTFFSLAAKSVCVLWKFFILFLFSFRLLIECVSANTIAIHMDKNKVKRRSEWRRELFCSSTLKWLFRVFVPWI